MEKEVSGDNNLKKTFFLALILLAVSILTVSFVLFFEDVTLFTALINSIKKGEIYNFSILMNVVIYIILFYPLSAILLWLHKKKRRTLLITIVTLLSIIALSFYLLENLMPLLNSPTCCS